MHVRKATLGLVTLASLLVAAPALGDQTIEAAPTLRYTVDSVTIAQGEKLTFSNKDSVQHDVTSTADFDHKALFSTPLIGRNASAVVEGTEYLKTGSYTYYCSVHPEQMKGTLIVSSAGTPVPRPGSASVTAVSRKLSAVKKDGKLTVTVTGASGASSKVTAKATVGGKSKTLATKTVKIGSSGSAKVTLKLSSTLRKAIAKSKKLVVSFTAKTGSDTSKVKRTYS